jgi:hypothetical protein
MPAPASKPRTSGSLSDEEVKRGEKGVGCSSNGLKNSLGGMEGSEHEYCIGVLSCREPMFPRKLSMPGVSKYQSRGS